MWEDTMNVVGFDVAKDSLVAARIDKSGIVKEHWNIANSELAIKPLLIALRDKHKHLVVASEATGDYHRLLALTCLDLGINFRLLNPLTVKRFIRTTVRKRKTDITDAEAIARVALQGEGNLISYSDLNIVKPILRTSISLTQIAQMCDLMGQRMSALVPEDKALTNELTQCQLRLKQASTAFRDYAAKHTDKHTRKLLMSIPGIANNLVTDIMVEIGDVSRFKGPKQLIAYAGLDPKVLQSGKTLNRYGHITKRGSKHLRRALFLSASVAKRCDSSFKSVYDKKRNEGKRYKEANIVVARKILRVIYAVWTNDKPYQQKTN
jgi:transposase